VKKRGLIWGKKEGSTSKRRVGIHNLRHNDHSIQINGKKWGGENYHRTKSRSLSGHGTELLEVKDVNARTWGGGLFKRDMGKLFEESKLETGLHIGRKKEELSFFSKGGD